MASSSCLCLFSGHESVGFIFTLFSADQSDGESPADHHPGHIGRLTKSALKHHNSVHDMAEDAARARVSVFTDKKCRADILVKCCYGIVTNCAFSHITIFFEFI